MTCSRLRLLPAVLCCLWAGLPLPAQEVAPRPEHGEPPAPERYPAAELLTETPQLAAWMESPTEQPVLIDARPREEYLAGHLPGARNLESDGLQDPERKPLFLPATALLDKLCVQAGIDPQSKVVVYDAQGGRLAARVWFLLWSCGHEHVSLLNGGLLKWKDEKRALSREVGAPARAGTWHPQDPARGVCSLPELKGFLPPPAAPGQIPFSTLLDARSFTEYSGQDVRSKLGGHVPGAVNLPWDSVLRPVTPGSKIEGERYLVWRDAPEIHALLRAGGVTPQFPVAVYCQSGGRAAHLLFTLRLMGFPTVSNYCGGWREYGNREDVEIER